MDRLLRGILVTALGIGTTVLTAVGLVYLELRYDCAIYGFVYGFVLPFGALLSGMVAASGYWIGSRIFSYRPGRIALANMLAVSVANFFLIYWLKYTHLKVDGESIRDWMPFAAYLRFTLTHTALRDTHFPGDPINLGVAGYGFALLLMAGFALGGWFVYAITRSAAYCEACSLYMQKQGSQTRYFVSREEMAGCGARFKAEAGRGRFRKAMELHAAAGTRQAGANTGYSIAIEVSHCSRCGEQWLELVGKQRVNNAWTRISDARYSSYCAERIDVLEQLANAN